MKGKIFNAQEVQALILGKKTQFREVIKKQPKSNINPVKLANLTRTWQWATKESRRECPYQIGQKIFCKESFALWFEAGIFAADCIGWQRRDMLWKWKPAQHMKQEQSRLTLQIKEIRVERLAGISKEDIIKEGFKYDDRGYFSDRLGRKHIPAQNAFEEFWNATHKKPEEKFEASPFCWVIDFEVVK
ncbi:MAG: hypothetical protein WCJ58_00830 [bacterium]